MNIFYLDEDPVISCSYLMDIHVRKMTLETCQLLMTTDVLHGYRRPYRPTHVNHPCRLALEDITNYLWLCRYFEAICGEYRFRFNHDHACSQYMVTFYFNRGLVSLCKPNFPQCFPDVFKRENVIDGYREYYRWKYKNFLERGIAHYTKRRIPWWL